MDERLETFGSVEPDPSRSLEISAPHAGTVLSLEVVAGQAVERGDPLLVLGPVPSGSPDVDRARIELRFARRELARIRALHSLHLATNGDVQKAERGVATSRSALRALGLAGKRAPVTLRAPVAGIVGQVWTRSGARVAASQKVLLLAPASALAVRAGFELENLPELAPGLPVAISSIYADAPASVSAELPALHRIADPHTQLVEALISIPSPPAWLVPGERVRLRVVLHRRPSALRVPRSALSMQRGRAGVFAVRDGRAHFVPLEILARNERWLAVADGLAPGEFVATRGRSALSDGMAVRVASGTP